VRWGVFDGMMKQVAVFDYRDRAAADTKVAELVAKKGTVHFLQVVKEPMPEPPPAAEETPLPPATPAAASVAVVAKSRPAAGRKASAKK